MPPEKKQKLRLTRLDTVGFVDRGANPVADITLWKRDDTGDDMADPKKLPDEVSKALKDLGDVLQKCGYEKAGYATATDGRAGYATATDADLDALMAALSQLMEKLRSGYATASDRSGYATASDRSGYATASDRMPFLKRMLKGLGFSDAQVAAVEQVDAQPEPVNAEVTKRLADADAKVEKAQREAAEATERVAKLELAQRTADAVAKAKGYAHLPVKPEEFGVILRKVNDGEKLTDTERAELERALAANNEVVRTSKLFSEIGSNSAPEGSAKAKVEKMADEIRKSDPKLDASDARARVYRDHPELMAEVEAEDRERASRR